MYVDERIEQKLSDPNATVEVVITCKDNVLQVEKTLKNNNINVTDTLHEFLIIHATIGQRQLEDLISVMGIGSIELDDKVHT